uniref:Putative secreted protein n=1 Tax=Ixodes ricinus TaxID=34613 RepID=A0A6B0U1V9_IXORI
MWLTCLFFGFSGSHLGSCPRHCSLKAFILSSHIFSISASVMASRPPENRSRLSTKVRRSVLRSYLLAT